MKHPNMTPDKGGFSERPSTPKPDLVPPSQRQKDMIEPKTWQEFRDSKLLWWVNRTLHLFGWAIVCEVENDRILSVYPAKVKFRGFSEESEADGFTGLTEYLEMNIKNIKDEMK